ncbi:MAG: hypothetical protein HC771_12230 [Synechococcales cyanobacterium CRU_2_2]|nr:hypothetical protein [Synechococcales cyanobacterium CRU_2_2]
MSLVSLFNGFVDQVAAEVSDLIADFAANRDISLGTTFPASPALGQRFVRTDIGEEFVWDGRGKWLSSAGRTFTFTGSPSAARGFKLDNSAETPLATAGVVLPYSCTVVQYFISTAFDENGVLALNKNGVSVDTLTMNSFILHYKLSTNIDFEQGDRLLVTQQSTTTGTWTRAIVCVHVRRRAS